MEIIIDGFPKDNQVLLEQISITYIQDEDCTGDRDDVQELTIETRDGGGGKFYNIKTGKNGWSISPDKNEIDEIINDFTNRLTKCNT